MSFLSYSTTFKGVVDIFMHDPKGYLPFTQLMASIMDTDSELARAEREMLALYVSARNACHYCVGSHKAVLCALDVDPALIAAAEKGQSKHSKMQAVLDFGGKLTQAPGAVDESDIAALRQVGWSDQAIEDVIKVVSLFSFLNRLVDGMGVKGSADGFVQAGRMIAEHGYGPVVQMVQGKAI